MAPSITLTQVVDSLSKSPGHILSFNDAGAYYARNWLQKVRCWHAFCLPYAKSQVGIYFEDPTDFAAALWGAWHAGAIPVLLPPIWKSSEIYTSYRLLPVLDAELERQVCADTPRTYVQLDVLEGSEVRMVIPTSGSTQAAVWIEKKLCQLDKEIQDLEVTFGQQMGSSPIYATVPHHHIYGLLFRVLWPIAARRSIYQKKYSPHIGDDVSSGATLITSPAYLKRMMPISQGKKHLGTIFTSGDRLTDDVAKNVQENLGLQPIEIYGSTETGGIAWRQGQSVYRCLPRVEVSIRKERIWVRSAYLPDNNWWETTDKAIHHQEGWQLLGRCDNVVKIEDKRVSLSHIERIAMTLPAVDKARAVVVHHARRQCVAVAFSIVSGEDTDVSRIRMQLRQAYARHLEPTVRPRYFQKIEHWPVNDMGKTTEKHLTEIFDKEWKKGLPEVVWQSLNESHACIHLSIERHLPVLSGHFAKQLILPGVLQIDWAVLLASQAFTLIRNAAVLESVKFRQAFRPPCAAQLDLRWDKDKHILVFKWSSEDQLYSEGVIRWHKVS